MNNFDYAIKLWTNSARIFSGLEALDRFTQRRCCKAYYLSILSVQKRLSEHLRQIELEMGSATQMEELKKLVGSVVLYVLDEMRVNKVKLSENEIRSLFITDFSRWKNSDKELMDALRFSNEPIADWATEVLIEEIMANKKLRRKANTIINLTLGLPVGLD